MNIVHSARSDASVCFMGSIAAGGAPWLVTVTLNGAPVSMKIDTGADVTAIPSSAYATLDQQALTPSRRTLTGANNGKLDVRGVFDASLSLREHQWSKMCLLLRT